VTASEAHPPYRKVVLTSWDRRMSDGERDPPATARLVLTSWDRRMSPGERDPPLPRLWENQKTEIGG